jgi:hypothetical protein
MQTNPQIELYWRAGPMLGVTEHIVVCPTCGTIIRPEITSVGEEGWHGTHTYSHEHPLAILGLLQSGFGTNRRHILTLPGDLTNHKVADLLTEAGRLWDARKLVSKTDVEEFMLNKLADTTPPREKTQETDTLEKLLLSRNPSKHLQDCLEKRRAFLNFVEKLGYRQLTEDEEVFLTSCPDVREYGYFIWDEESDNYLFDAYVEVHVRDGDGEVLAITLTLTTRKLTPEAKEWLEVKQYVLYEHENFRELVRKFLEQVEKKAGKPKPDQ